MFIMSGHCDVGREMCCSVICLTWMNYQQQYSVAPTQSLCNITSLVMHDHQVTWLLTKTLNLNGFLFRIPKMRSCVGNLKGYKYLVLLALRQRDTLLVAVNYAI